MVFQSYALYPHMSVRKNIAFPMKMAKIDLETQNTKVEAAAKSLNLTDYLDRKPGQLSGGQRQCVAISRAAGWGSKLIVMDEPTAALGIQETTRVENIIRGLKERGVPVIIVSHNLRQVFNLVDRIVVFRRGRIAGVLDAKTASGNDVVAMITGVDQGVHEGASYI